MVKVGSHQLMFSVRRMNALGLIRNLSYQLRKENFKTDFRKKLMASGVSMPSPETCFFSHDTKIKERVCYRA